MGGHPSDLSPDGHKVGAIIIEILNAAGDGSLVNRRTILDRRYHGEPVRAYGAGSMVLPSGIRDCAVHRQCIGLLRGSGTLQLSKDKTRHVPLARPVCGRELRVRETSSLQLLRAAPRLVQSLGR